MSEGCSTDNQHRPADHDGQQAPSHDLANGPPSGIERRQHPRYPYPIRDGVKVVLPESATTFPARPQTLSAGGIGLLHGSFVHPQQRCVVALITLNNAEECVTGKIVRCRHVQGHVHDVGIQFDDLVDINRFVRVEDTTAVQPVQPRGPSGAAPPYPPAIMSLIQELHHLASTGAARDLMCRHAAKLTRLLHDTSA